MTKSGVFISNMATTHTMAPPNTTSIMAFIGDGIKDPIGLTNGGATKGSTSYAGWSATQVIAIGSGGYEVLWSHTGGNKYDVWQVNSSGNFVSSIEAKLWEDELKFGVDLNGDKVKGLGTVDDQIGSVHLKYGDNTYNGAPQYYIDNGITNGIIGDGIKDPIGLTNGGATKGSTSYAGWSATQVIAIESGGYEVLWSHTGGKKYEVWQVNSSGNFVSSIEANLWEDELKFGVDLNGDKVKGLGTVDDQIGSVHLKHEGNKYFIVKGSDDPIGLTYGGAPKGPNSFTGWSATQVEASKSGGFEVLWSHSSGIWQVWKVNALGSFQSRYSAQLWKHENTFDYDLNRDTTKGLMTIEDNGNVDLAHGDNRFIGDTQYYIVDGGNDPVGLTSGGASKGPNSFPGWSATQVEASASGGYEVFWSHSSGKTTAWKVDALGSYQSHISVTKSVTESGITIIKYNDHSWKFGGNGNDSLSGSIGNDTIDGGDGNDIIYGGSGAGVKDILTGNLGADIFISCIADATTDLLFADTITDFINGTDKIGLEDRFFSDLSFSNDGGGTKIVDNISSKILFWLDGIDYSVIDSEDFITTDLV